MAAQSRPRDLKKILREYVDVQTAILTELRKILDQRDWKYLTDIPRKGSITVNGEEWRFLKHGTGIRFRAEDRVVDANSHLDKSPQIFDPGRIAEYAESLKEEEALWNGKIVRLEHTSLPSTLRDMCSAGELRRCVDLHGDAYLLA